MNSDQLWFNPRRIVTILLSITIILTIPGTAVAHGTMSTPSSEEKTFDGMNARTAENCGIEEAWFTDKIDRDGDGYYSNFSLIIILDTNCWGEYDGDFLNPGPHIEPLIEINIDGVSRRGPLKADYLVKNNTRGDNIRMNLTEGGKFFQERGIERKEVIFTFTLYDNDNPQEEHTASVNMIDRWNKSIKFESSSNDDPDDGTKSGSDGDDLSDARERELGTDPHNKDSDGDLYWDGDEVKSGTDPTDPRDYPIRDSDDDGYTDREEVQAGTDAHDPTDYP